MRLEEFLAEKAQTKSFTAGEQIAVQGAQAEEAYIIKQGRVKVYQDCGGAESVMAVLGPDEIFGEMAILRFDHYTMSVKAEEDTEVYVITPDMIHEHLRETHPLIKVILNTLLDRMKEVNEVLVDIDTAQKT